MAQEDMPVFVFGCMSCGKTVSGKEKACPRCGASFEGVVFECPFCGEPVSPNQTRCKNCGTEFGAFAEDVSETAAVALDGTGRTANGEKQAVQYECPECGELVDEDDDECPHCHARFE